MSREYAAYLDHSDAVSKTISTARRWKRTNGPLLRRRWPLTSMRIARSKFDAAECTHIEISNVVIAFAGTRTLGDFHVLRIANSSGISCVSFERGGRLPRKSVLPVVCAPVQTDNTCKFFVLMIG